MNKSSSNYQKLKHLTLATSFLVATELSISANPTKAISIDLNFSSTTSSQAQTAFQQAADLWESKFDDNVNIYLNVGIDALASGVLASANSRKQVFSYTNIKTALTTDAKSTDDFSAVSNLQSGSALSFYTYDEGTYRLDNDTSGTDSNNNKFLGVNKANLKALGLLGDVGSDCSDSVNTNCDAVIKFSNSFVYDFDPSNGITDGAFDFVGIAAHEIGHALGFNSGVDIIDASPTTDRDANAVWTVLDLFRYSDTSGNLDLRYGGNPYLSFNGGANSVGLLSTGAFNGDGNQASHWKDSLGLGIMDPTLATGELASITSLDLRAFDAIGWDLSASAAVPFEFSPSFGILFVSGLFGMKKTTDALKKRKTIKN
jgi:hypothetical protein